MGRGRRHKYMYGAYVCVQMYIQERNKMNLQRCLLVAVISLALEVHALAPFWKPCPIPDPAFDDCLFDAAVAAYPYIINGTEEYKFPVLDPLHEDKLAIQKGSNYFGIMVDITNASITGLREATLKLARIDLVARRISLEVFIPQLNVTSDYYLAGQLLGVFVNRTGDDTMVMDEVDGRMIADYDTFKEVGRDGMEHEYFNVTEVDVQLNISQADMQFNNLFNGNHFLESRANAFLSRNWRDLFDFLGSSLNKAIGDAYNRMMISAYESLAMDEMFPLKDVDPDELKKTKT